ncbi:MAG: DUF4124 domain-containing protein [Xanthomonadales bacterium]|nr:DUF4124 domain-containing protein [Xanthomonadales bacterium]
MRNTSLYVTVLIATLVLAATDAVAVDDVYRWVDEDGNVHFGDNPPQQANAEVVKIQQNSTGVEPAPPGALLNTPQQPSRAQQQRDERELRRAEDAERKQALASGCDSRREAVAQLEPKPRVMVTTEGGEVYRMDDDDRLEELNKLKAYISENCKD